MTQQQGLLTETDLVKIGNLIDTRLDAKLSDYATKNKKTYRNLGTDTTILKQQVKHLYTTFNIK